MRTLVTPFWPDEARHRRTIHTGQTEKNSVGQARPGCLRNRTFVTGNVGRDRDRVGADAGVPVPRRIEIIACQIVAEQTNCDKQDASEQHKYDELHRPARCAAGSDRYLRVATVGQLSASIAHEISQPIAAAGTNANAALRWLRVHPPNLEEVRRALGRIVENSSRAGDVIGGIRALIKKAPQRKDRLDINEVIREIIPLTQAEVLKNGISLQMQLADSLPTIQGDRVQLQQVILNLFINAVEAMSGMSNRMRELLVSAGKADSDGVLVTVQDSGPGFLPRP
jgi:C4-dicarboxylate-specific signal transduction histidine kinase